MGIKVALEHRTSYSFDRLVEVYPHVVRLRPAPHCRTPIEAYSRQSDTLLARISPSPCASNFQPAELAAMLAASD